MANCRHDKLSAKTRKEHRCQWCSQTIVKGAQMVRISGINDRGPFAGKFHPECWRAELHYWRENPRADGWPEDPYARGRSDDDLTAPPKYTDRPLTVDELKNRYKYADQWAVPPPEPEEIKFSPENHRPSQQFAEFSAEIMRRIGERV